MAYCTKRNKIPEMTKLYFPIQINLTQSNILQQHICQCSSASWLVWIMLSSQAPHFPVWLIVLYKIVLVGPNSGAIKSGLLKAANCQETTHRYFAVLELVSLGAEKIMLHPQNRSLLHLRSSFYIFQQAHMSFSYGTPSSGKNYFFTGLFI